MDIGWISVLEGRGEWIAVPKRFDRGSIAVPNRFRMAHVSCFKSQSRQIGNFPCDSEIGSGSVRDRFRIGSGSVRDRFGIGSGSVRDRFDI